MNIAFKKLTEEHIEQVRLWRNSDHVKKYMLNKQYISIDQQKQWFDSVRNDKTKVYLLVFIEDDLLGLLDFINIDFDEELSADWGFYIGNKKYLGRGLGSEVVNLGIKYAFDTLNLKTINAQIIFENVASIKLHEKFKFKTVGRSDKIILMNLNKKDFCEQKNRY